MRGTSHVGRLPTAGTIKNQSHTSYFLTVSLSYNQRRFIFDEMNSILPATPADVDTLVHMSRKIFHDSFDHLNTPENMQEYMDRAFNPQQLLSELNNPMSEFYFIRADDVIAGFIKLNRGPAQSDIYDDTSLEIERIYVDKQFQGLGLGGKLIAKAKERAHALQLHTIWLGVWEKNPDAIRFYERHGFVRFGSHPFRMGDEIQTDVLMQCKTVRQ